MYDSVYNDKILREGNMSCKKGVKKGITHTTTCSNRGTLYMFQL